MLHRGLAPGVVACLVWVAACGGGDQEGGGGPGASPPIPDRPDVVEPADGSGLPDPGGDWAAEAQGWYDNMRADQIAEGGAGFARYLSPDVAFDDGPIFAVGPEDKLQFGDAAIEKVEWAFGPECLTMEPDFFVSVDGLVEFWLFDWAPLDWDVRADTRRSAHGLALLGSIDASGAELLIAGRAVDEWQDRRIELLPWIDRAEVVADSWTRVWSGTRGVDSLYGRGAHLVDTIAGIDLTGREAISDLAAAPGRWEVTTVGPDDVRGIYAFIRLRDGAMSLDELVLVVAGHDVAGCPGEMLLWLTLDDGLVVEEVRYWPIDRARRCLPVDDLPAGWWTPTYRPPPTAPPHEDLATPTDPVVVGDATIPVYNGTPALNRLVAWGLGRFDAAGLTPPAVVSVTFTRHSALCDRAWAQYQATAEGAELTFCFDDDRVCADDSCDHYTPAARLSLLHELGHAWMYVTLDDGVREQFTDHVGLDAWNDPADDWVQRGIEHAAETIAWGLMDREMRMIQIEDPSKDDLATGFGILTSTDPLPRTDDWSATDLPIALE